MTSCLAGPLIVGKTWQASIEFLVALVIGSRSVLDVNAVHTRALVDDVSSREGREQIPCS